jgi:hypothetical protein
LLLPPLSFGLLVGVSAGEGLSFEFAGFVMLIITKQWSILFNCPNQDLGIYRILNFQASWESSNPANPDSDKKDDFLIT